MTSSAERGVAVALTAVRATFTVVRPALSESPPVDRTSSTTPFAKVEYVAPEMVPCEVFLPDGAGQRPTQASRTGDLHQGHRGVPGDNQGRPQVVQCLHDHRERTPLDGAGETAWWGP